MKIYKAWGNEYEFAIVSWVYCDSEQPWIVPSNIVHHLNKLNILKLIINKNTNELLYQYITLKIREVWCMKEKKSPISKTLKF